MFTFRNSRAPESQSESLGRRDATNSRSGEETCGVSPTATGTIQCKPDDFQGAGAAPHPVRRIALQRLGVATELAAAAASRRHIGYDGGRHDGRAGGRGRNSGAARGAGRGDGE